MRRAKSLAALVIALLIAACAPLQLPAGPSVAKPAIVADRLVVADGVSLPLRSWQPIGCSPRAVIVALHGFNDYSSFFDGIGHWLADRGIASYAYDQRGFGAAPNRGVWPGSAALIGDLRAAVDAARARYPELPIFLFGESMGAAVVMTALTEPDPPPVTGEILSAPAVWGRRSMPWYQTTALWLAVHAVPDGTLTGRGLGIRASDNIEMLQALGRDPLVIKSTRIDAIWGLVNLMDEAMAASSALDGSVLILYGERDEVIPPAAIAQMVSRLPHETANRPRVVLYPDGYHMLTRDLNAEVVWRDIAAYIDTATTPSPSSVGFCPGPNDGANFSDACSQRTVCAIVPTWHS
ncbi:MAG: alpha/beta hydrolase [Rhodospirillales bacterium]|nr:alpha/beta hydrolase [Rhodospirillales bacterium]